MPWHTCDLAGEVDIRICFHPKEGTPERQGVSTPRPRCAVPMEEPMMLEDRCVPTFPPPDKRQRPPFPRVPASPRVAERTLVVNPSTAALVAQVDATRIADSIAHL